MQYLRHVVTPRRIRLKPAGLPLRSRAGYGIVYLSVVVLKTGVGPEGKDGTNGTKKLARADYPRAGPGHHLRMDLG